MQSFDWSREWIGDDTVVVLTRRERALLTLFASNVMGTPSTFLTNYDDETDKEDVNDFLSLLQFHLMDDMIIPEQKTNRVRLSADSNVGIAGSLTWTSSTTQKGAGYYATGNVINSRVIWNRVHLLPGKYTIEMLGMTNTNCGIATVQTNEVTPVVLTTIDMYQNPLTQNVYRGNNNISINFDDYKDIEIKMLSKNPISTGYVINFNWIEFIRTGDL